MLRHTIKARKWYITCDHLVIGWLNDNVINWLFFRIFSHWTSCMLYEAVWRRASTTSVLILISSTADVTLFHTCVWDNCSSLQLLAAKLFLPELAKTLKLIQSSCRLLMECFFFFISPTGRLAVIKCWCSLLFMNGKYRGTYRGTRKEENCRYL